MTWEISGYNDLNVTLLANNIVNVMVPDENWNGTELLSFRATNPDSLTNENTGVFTVIPVNDPPQISSINIDPINVGETFANIYLDNYLRNFQYTAFLWEYCIFPLKNPVGAAVNDLFKGCILELFD